MEKQNLYFKVPFSLKEKVKNDNLLHIVGIIDSSGSMSSWWKWIAEFYNTSIPNTSLHTITFDHKVHKCPNNILSKRIQDHGGGRTAIPEVFQEFENHLKTVDKEKNITVLFISDGQDNNLQTLQERMGKLKGNPEDRKINFICLGIKSGFPTFLSMRLRQLYHRGDDAIPALYLVEYVSEKAFFNKFEGIKKYFYTSGSMQLEPSVQIFPWDESVVDSAYEGSWVICKSSEISVEGKIYKIGNEPLKVEQVVEIIRGWVQQIQLTQLTNKKEAEQIAQIALKEMKEMIDTLNKQLGVNVLMKLDEQNNQKGDSLCLRAKKNYVIRNGSKLQWFLEEIEQLAQGIAPKFEDEFEAAKKMNLGTITGKYQQKVLALKNITADDFQQIIQDFIAVYKQNKLTPSENQSSIKSILLQPDFLEGLSYIKNQYDFVEMFELHGYGIKMKRSEQTNDNIYKTEIKSMTKNLLTMPEIIQKDFKITQKGKETVQFTSIDLQHQESEHFLDEINSVLPFFSKQSDSDLTPFLNTKLIHFLLSYTITQNADISFEDSYLVSMGHFINLLFNQYNSKCIEEKQSFQQQIFESLQVFYGQNKGFQQRCILMAKNPEMYIKCNPDEIMIKTIAIAFYLVQGKIVNQEQAERLFEILNLQFFKKLLNQFDNEINDLLKPEFTDEEKLNLKKYFQDHLNDYFSLSSYRKDFSITLEKQLKSSKSDTVIPKKILYNSDNNEMSLAIFEQFGKDLVSQDKQQIYKWSDYSVFAKHISEHPDEFFEIKVNRENIGTINAYVLDKINQENIKFIPGFSVLFKECEDMYSQNFHTTHWGVKPISKEEVQKICKEKNIEFEKLQFSVSGLLKNACCSQQCAFFLQPRDDLDKHLAGWKGKVPRGFHRFVSSRLDMNLKELLKESKRKWGKKFPTNFGVDEKYVKKYLKETLDAYQINKYGKIVNKNDEEEKEEEKDQQEGYEFASIQNFVKKNWLKRFNQQEQMFNPFKDLQQENNNNNNNNNKLNENLQKNKQQQQNNNNQNKNWQCDSCTFENQAQHKECQICGWNPKNPDEWICAQCTFKNSPDSKTCQMCFQGKKPEVIQKAPEKPQEEKKEDKQEVQQGDKKFQENQEVIPEDIRNKWNSEQKYIKTLLIEDDSLLDFNVKTEGKVFEVDGLKYVAGVDISFSQNVENLACSYLSVLSYPDLKIVYEDFEIVNLTVPYVSGFLAFREAAHLLNLFDKLFKKSPELIPQVIMVDGNGILHQNGCGLASHLGVLLDIPTIGVGKTAFYVDGLKKDQIQADFTTNTKEKGEWTYLKGESGRVWGAALRSENNIKNPIYVSIGHKISIDTACQLAQICSKFRIPEPVRTADLNSREKIRNITQEQISNISNQNKLVFLTDLLKDEMPDISDDSEEEDKQKKNKNYNYKKKYQNKKYKKK